MALPPAFLDELRRRVSLTAVVGRAVKLIRRGREYTGLCPFHSEKTPSFTVSEDKGFYHCFGCGAHGDVIGFVMHTEGLSFPEAVERLSAEAGIAVPLTSLHEREEARAQATLHGVLDAACRWFERTLAAPEGGVARDYLARRGVAADSVARFRIGYAPDQPDALKRALLSAEVSEKLLVEAGLLVAPDDRPGTYDRFRHRVIFPITDRRGRVIAFGGRTLGDHKAKYINSPETPVFHKGQVLYGLAQAREPAHRTGRVVVVEGYLDVIALSSAGIAETVAPLGTALTESHIAELWRLAPEPVLCFDGDRAGVAAAARAAERALPLLKPGHSLRFALLPAGDDPDSFVRRAGRAAVDALLDEPVALDAMVWRAETAARDLSTPERRAALEARLDQLAESIADRRVQYQYRAAFRTRLRAAFAPAAPRPWLRDGRRHGGMAGPGPLETIVPRSAPTPAEQREQGVLLLALINHPVLLDSFAEAVGSITLADPVLDKLRQEILKLSAASSALDSDQVRRQLREAGFGESLDLLHGPEVRVHDAFARPGQGFDRVRAGLEQVLARLARWTGRAQVDEAERAYVADPTDENWTRWQQLIEANHRAEAETMSLDNDTADRQKFLPNH